MAWFISPVSGLCIPCDEHAAVCPYTTIRIDFTLVGSFSYVTSCYYGDDCIVKVVYNGSTYEREFTDSSGSCLQNTCSGGSLGISTLFSASYISLTVPIWKDFAAGLWTSSVAMDIYVDKPSTDPPWPGFGIRANNIEVFQRSVSKATQALSIDISKTYTAACTATYTKVATVTAYDDNTFTIT
jgi:hypothetical protein